MPGGMMKRTYVKHFIFGLVWVTGLLLAGSDSDYMPWANLTGVAAFSAVSWLMNGRQLRSVFGKRYQTSVKRSAASYMVPSASAMCEHHTCRPVS